MRVKVPFGRSTRVGVVMECSDSSGIAPDKLKPALEVLDSEPLFKPFDLEFLRWTAGYYHHPLGEVVATALPSSLRRGKLAHYMFETCLRLVPRCDRSEVPERAHRQRALFQLLQDNDGMLSASFLADLDWDWRSAARGLQNKGLVVFENAPATTPSPPTTGSPPNPRQRQAIAAVTSSLGSFATFLLYGITGSGKTEVYLGVIDEVVRQGAQALVLFPEIALTPQLQNRFEKRLGVPIGIYHSGLNDSERLNAWLGFQRGELPILLGNRSAVFVPMAHPGIIVIDEEHDPSYKQQEGFRFSARDLAVVRARLAGHPVIMGSATPSLESLQNTRRGRYQLLQLPERAGAANPPKLLRMDIRNQKLTAGLGPQARTAIKEVLERREQVLLFLNRRGFAPVLICHACGWTAGCPRCDARLVLHQHRERLRCHHCDHEGPVPDHCPACGSKALLPLGQGTERVEKELQTLFPQATISRIDRDTTRRKGSLEEIIGQVKGGDIDILLGTQMLAKGMTFPMSPWWSFSMRMPACTVQISGQRNAWPS